MNRLLVSSLVIGIVSGCGSQGSAASPTPSANPTVAASTPAPTPAPSPSPSPSPELIARGNFVTAYETVELEATGEGASVMGRMAVSGYPGEEQWFFTVDLECTRTSEDGVITIGGLITDSTNLSAPVGTWAAISLKRGSPVQATVSYLRGGHPIAYAPSCLASLDAEFGSEPSTFGKGNPYLQPIEGTVEFGP